MREVKEPTLLKFENEGDSISGRLVAADRVTLGGKPAQQYTLAVHETSYDRDGGILDKGATGEYVVVNGTTGLDKKMRLVETDSIIHIAYKGEVSVPGSGNRMRAFDVFVL